jgi:hypothetical protein
VEMQWFIAKVSSDSEWQIRTDYNRVHPPLEIKGVRPAETAEDTTEHAGGGTYVAGYTGYTAPYTPAPYSSSSAYPQSSQQGMYDHAPESHSTSADGYTNSYFPASSSNTGYSSGSYGSGGAAYNTADTSTAAGGYGTSDYYAGGHASSQTTTGYETRELHSVPEGQEQWGNPRQEEQTDRRGHGQGRKKRQDQEPEPRDQSRRRRGDPEHNPEPEEEDYPEEPTVPPGDDDLYD